MKKTEWFPYNIKPVRIGVYEVWNEGWYAHWNGRRWGWPFENVAMAYANPSPKGASQFKDWRGLTKGQT